MKSKGLYSYISEDFAQAFCHTAISHLLVKAVTLITRLVVNPVARDSRLPYQTSQIHESFVWEELESPKRKGLVFIPSY